MILEILLTVVSIVLLYYLYFIKPLSSLEKSQPEVIASNLPRFERFFQLLTDEKTADHVGSSSMKTLRSMLDLPKLEPAILRSWSRAIRKNAGTFSKVRAETVQLQKNIIGPDGEEYAHMLAQCEFDPIVEANFVDKKPEPVVLGCMVRFLAQDAFGAASDGEEEDDGERRTAAAGSDDIGKEKSSSTSTTTNNQKTKTKRVLFKGFHVLPPVDKRDKPFDIASFLDPMELDQFAERAVDALFDIKVSSDPMNGLFEYCVKPLQDLYDVSKESKKEDEKSTEKKKKTEGEGEDGFDKCNSQDDDDDDDDDDDEAKKELQQRKHPQAPVGNVPSSSPSPTAATAGLPPRERRAKLAKDLEVVKSAMGILGKKFDSTTTMTDADMDTHTFNSVQAVCARVSITGPNRDCIMTLFIVLDALSPFGCSVAKYSFALTATKQKMMLYDQDSGSQMASC